MALLTIGGPSGVQCPPRDMVRNCQTTCCAASQSSSPGVGTPSAQMLVAKPCQVYLLMLCQCEFLSSTFSLCMNVEPRLSLRTRLACPVHTSRMHNP